MKKRLSILGVLCAASAIAYACGGSSTTDIDGGNSDGGGGDSTMGNDASNGNDSGASDTGTNDGQPLGDAGCPQYVTDTCDAGCATGTICVSHNVGPMVVSGCYPDTQCTKNESACQCLSECVCKGPGSTCQMTNNGISCNGGTISRREFKKDITYVDDAERAELANEALHTQLAEYRYKAEPETQQRHLGFIIDDMPNASPAVESDKTHVDLYGYSSMLLATVQEQQKQIDELKKQVDELKKHR